MDMGQGAAEPGAPGVRRALGFLPPGRALPSAAHGWQQEGEGWAPCDPTRSGESQASPECSLQPAGVGGGAVKVGGL